MAVLNGFEELKAASPSTDLPFLDPSTATAIALPVDCHGSALSHCHPFGLSPRGEPCERRERVLPPLPHTHTMHRGEEHIHDIHHIHEWALNRPSSRYFGGVNVSPVGALTFTQRSPSPLKDCSGKPPGLTDHLRPIVVGSAVVCLGVANRAVWSNGRER